MRRPIAWPVVDEERPDMYDEERLVDLGYDEYLTAPLDEFMSRESYDVLAEQLVDADRRGFPKPDIAATLLVDGCVPAGKEPGAGVRTGVASLGMMASLSVDYQPSHGSDIPDIVLGPWVEELDLSNPNHRRAIQIATGMGAFLASDGVPFSPWHRMRREKPKADMVIRQSFWSVWEAPMSLYTIESMNNGRALLTDVLDVRPIDGLVTIPPDSVANIFVDEPVAYYGRVVRLKEGHMMVVGLALDAIPDTATTTRWLEASLHRRRLCRRTMTASMHQRDHAHQMIRYLMAWRWAHAGTNGLYSASTSTK